MEKLKMHSPNLTEENIAKLRELFPGCVTEAKDESGNIRATVDFDQLRQELSEHVVEGAQERYQLNWPGKREALFAANAPIAKTLRAYRDESVNFDSTRNLFIEGDNLDALKLLQETYLGRVKLIYIDPPYNTGKDFIYRDNFATSKEGYLEETGQLGDDRERLVSNPESAGRYHSNWLSMMYARLRLAKNLLKSDGVIFISIDDNEVASLCGICDEIFGRSNRLGILPVVSNLKGRSDDKYFATAHNYLVCYSKGAFTQLGVELPPEYLEDYPEVDSSGRRYRLQGLRKRGSEARREDRPKMHYPIFVDPATAAVSLEKSAQFHLEVLPKLSDGSDGRWRWGADTVSERVAELLAKTVGPEGRWDIFQIDYVDADGETKRTKPKSVWMGSNFANEAGTLEIKNLFGAGVFDNPKPTGLLDYIIEQSARDDIILDFFGGSGTTAHAVMLNNLKASRSNRYILVQLPEPIGNSPEAKKRGFETIADLAKERIRLAGAQIQEQSASSAVTVDIGFRVLKIDTSNMADVYYTPDAVKQADLLSAVDNIKPGRDNPEDLLFQVLVDWGVDLTLPIRKETVKGKTVFFVNAEPYDLIACFDKGVTEDLVKELAKHKPMRVVFRDNGFESDAVKINVDQIFRQLSPSTDVKSI
jgi:adenine-specific DNA-methyltransferase